MNRKKKSLKLANSIFLKIRRIRNRLFPENRRLGLLKNRVFNGKINTVIPKEENDIDHWEWHQRNIVFRGLPFSFNIGVFEYYINQITDFVLIEIENQLTKGDLHKYIIDNAIPKNKAAKIFEKEKKRIFMQHTPAVFLTGLISEYLLFLTAYKKKMLGIKIQGIIQRGLKTALTLSQRESQLANTRVLKHIGTDIFGFR